MVTPRMSVCLGCIFFLTGHSGHLRADDKRDESTKKRVAYLIDMLASKNKAPKIVGDDSGKEIEGKPMGEIAKAKFDKSYNSDLQAPVYLAMQQLLAEGDIATLDLLRKHKDDNRYSLTIISIENAKNKTVGDISTRVFHAHIFPCKDEMWFMTKDQYGRYPVLGKKSFEEWWEEKKKLGLAKVQLEAIDEMLDFMKKVDVSKAGSWHPEAPRVTATEFEKNRKKNIQILTAVRDTILSTGKPYRPRTCFSWAEDMIALPW